MSNRKRKPTKLPAGTTIGSLSNAEIAMIRSVFNKAGFCLAMRCDDPNDLFKRLSAKKLIESYNILVELDMNGTGKNVPSNYRKLWNDVRRTLESSKVYVEYGDLDWDDNCDNNGVSYDIDDSTTKAKKKTEKEDKAPAEVVTKLFPHDRIEAKEFKTLFPDMRRKHARKLIERIDDFIEQHPLHFTLAWALELDAWLSKRDFGGMTITGVKMIGQVNQIDSDFVAFDENSCVAFHFDRQTTELLKYAYGVPATMPINKAGPGWLADNNCGSYLVKRLAT